MAGQGKAGKGRKGRQSEAAEVGPRRSLTASSTVTAAVREGPMITWMESSYRSGGGRGGQGTSRQRGREGRRDGTRRVAGAARRSLPYFGLSRAE